MKVKELIEELQALHDKHGNLEVNIVDGFNCNVYEGDFQIVALWGVIDIGIGGLIKDEE